MKLIYICSPLKGDIEGNIKRANRYSLFVALSGCLPLAPHTIFTQFLDDNNESEREIGLALGIELLRRCDELWCFGMRMSEGMKAEIELAKKEGIPILRFNESCEKLEVCE